MNTRAESKILDVSINVLTLVLRAYLTKQSMDQLSAALKKGGIKDLLAFFPANKRETRCLEEHFKKAGLTQVAEWWTKKQYAALKETIIKDLSEMIEREESTEEVIRCLQSLDLVLLPFLDHCHYQRSSSRIPSSRK